MTQLGFDIDHRHDIARTRERLQALAKELLDADAVRTLDDRGNTPGVRFDHVRHAAEHRGILSGLEGTRKADPSMARLLSFGASVMRAAGGVACEYVSSKHANAKGRPVRVYRLAVVAKR